MNLYSVFICTISFAYLFFCIATAPRLSELLILLSGAIWGPESGPVGLVTVKIPSKKFKFFGKSEKKKLQKSIRARHR